MLSSHDHTSERQNFMRVVRNSTEIAYTRPDKGHKNSNSLTLMNMVWYVYLYPNLMSRGQEEALWDLFSSDVLKMPLNNHEFQFGLVILSKAEPNRRISRTSDCNKL